MEVHNDDDDRDIWLVLHLCNGFMWTSFLYLFSVSLLLFISNQIIFIAAF